MPKKIMSWNVNGIRSIFRKGFTEWFSRESPDIFCAQEIKAQLDQLTQESLEPEGYHAYWDWGERKSRIKASEASIEMNEVNLEDEKNNIIISIRQVYRNLQNLENQVEIQRKNERNAQLTYDINLERYRNGDLTSMDLNLYQTQLSQAKTNLVRALIDYKIELLNMKIQSMYDFEKDCSVVPDLGLE